MIEQYKNKIINNDCFDILKQLPDNSIDMILTDPPYFISQEIKITRGRDKMKFKGPDINLDFGPWDKQWDNVREYFKWTFKWIDECVRILKPGRILSIWFDRDKINFVSCYLQKKYGFKYKGYMAMIKTNPVPQARKQKFMTGWEEIGLWQKPGGKLIFNYQLGQQPDYIMVPIVGHTTGIDGITRLHPTQKPVAVAKVLIAYWTNEGDIVLDPFAGSGTIPVASYILNRSFIGIEADKRYYDIAVKRLNSLTSQMKMKFKERGEQKILFRGENE